jgi:predicted nucleic acid-binding protein
MMIFSNTTPIIALSSINQLNLLPTLFNEIYVVEEVVEECAEGGKIIVPDLTQLNWINVVKSINTMQNYFLMELDKGEKQTLNMAIYKNADYVIIDEKMARNIAEYLGLSVTGTLGILLKAKQQGHITSFSECAKSDARTRYLLQYRTIKKISLTSWRKIVLNLQKLGCSKNKISDLQPLHALTNLRELDCRDNQISQTEIERFKKAVLGCVCLNQNFQN